MESAGHPEFVDHPGDHRLTKHLPGLRIGLQNRHQDAVELAEGLFKEDCIIDILPLDTCGFETELDCIFGKSKVVLYAGEAFLFGSGEQLAIMEQYSGCVVVVTGDAENIHSSSFEEARSFTESYAHQAFESPHSGCKTLGPMFGP